MKLAFALGLRINGNIFLKSIASTGSVHVCLLVDDDLDEVDGGKKKNLDDFHVMQTNTNHIKKGNVQWKQGHTVESADDQERDSGEQHAPITADDQEGGSGEQHVVLPAVNKEQPIDNEEPLSEADYMSIIDNITVNTIDLCTCKGFQNPVLILS